MVKQEIHVVGQINSVWLVNVQTPEVSYTEYPINYKQQSQQSRIMSLFTF